MTHAWGFLRMAGSEASVTRESPLKNLPIHPFSAIAGATVLGSLLFLTGMQQSAGAQALPRLTAEQRDILAHMSIELIEDGQGALLKTIRFTGVNVQIVNGLGATNGLPADPTEIDSSVTLSNGVGNLIVGYNEQLGVQGPRAGSHNVVVGAGNDYSAFGGLVVGKNNGSSGSYASVIGGELNLASGYHSVVIGGWANISSAVGATVTGGSDNVASAFAASVSGGTENQANGPNASVSGGQDNYVSGGSATVSGGNSRVAIGVDDWVAGSLLEDS